MRDTDKVEFPIFFIKYINLLHKPIPRPLYLQPQHWHCGKLECFYKVEGATFVSKTLKATLCAVSYTTLDYRIGS
jgi:hypothetical protein